MKGMYTIRDAASVCKVSPRTIWRLIKDGHIPAVKVGARYRIPAAVVEGILHGRLPETHPTAPSTASPQTTPSQAPRQAPIRIRHRG